MNPDHIKPSASPQKEILCTLGPSSLNDYVLSRLSELGVGLLRINLSHTRLEDLPEIIGYVQSRTAIPICLDTEGAQIRTGSLCEGKITLAENERFRVLRKAITGNSSCISLYPDHILDQLETGDILSIDFNCVIAQIIEKRADELVLRVLTGGTVGQNKAVTVMNRPIVLPPLTDKDKQALLVGSRMGIRHVALSFASRPSDVDIVSRIAGEGTFIISKIESLSGLNHLGAIAARSDAILIDRGDLSREVAIEMIPGAQKHIIRRARRAGAKVYVATNLLESMVTSPAPTRAEINDIFNTLSDGADGLVLAAETAIGAYPVQCAMMVSRMISQFSETSRPFSVRSLRGKNSFLLVEPHGGTLVDRTRFNTDRKKLKKMKTLDVDETVLLSAEQIALGTFSPLQGFMTEKVLESVLNNCLLPGDVVWPIPIVLQATEEDLKTIRPGDEVALRLAGTGDIHAILQLEEIYSFDLDRMALLAFGTNDQAHPGVQLLRRRGKLFLGGSIELVKRLPSPYKHYELTPREVRAIFEHKGWSKVVGFHTRNVIHRAHEHIQLKALREHNCDGLFVHPIVGPKKQGDFSARIILRSYEIMLENGHYPEGKVLLSAFQNYSRYSGPREAVFTALCRKNFGCSHFIVGRDHTGVGNYYGPDDAEKLFRKLGNIGIMPIVFNTQHYCALCRDYVEQCEHGGEAILDISGTKGREMLTQLNNPPSGSCGPRSLHSSLMSCRQDRMYSYEQPSTGILVHGSFGIRQEHRRIRREIASRNRGIFRFDFGRR